ncbi:MAG: hypothetical protein RJB57_493, partial [Actinomycetota bacterium]
MPTLGRLALAVAGAWTIEQAVAVRAVVDVG